MRKAKEASVLYIVVPICFTIVCLSIWYGYPFNKITDQDLKIYQLALTAFAATVGIGTVVNSSRSTDTALKSMKLSEKKEVREQSSHLVTSSKVNSFKISPPMYKDEHIYSPTMQMGKPLHDLIYEHHDSHEAYKEAEKNFKRSLMSIQDERVDHENKLNMIHLLNIGKGVCLNIEYEFEFKNMTEFIGHSVAYNEEKMGEYDVVSPAVYPSYDIVVDEYKNHLKIITKDHALSYLTKQVHMTESEQYFYSVSEIIFWNNKQKTYIPFLQPGEDIFLPLPNEFMILCKHYLIMSIYKKYDNESLISKYIKPGINHLIDSESISPIGCIKMSYMDEEDVRMNNNTNERKELIFDVRIKDESIYKHDEDIYFYLEFTPISENTP